MFCVSSLSQYSLGDNLGEVTLALGHPTERGSRREKILFVLTVVLIETIRIFIFYLSCLPLLFPASSLDDN